MSAYSQVAVTITSLESRFRRLERPFRRLIQRAARFLGLRAISLELYLVGDRTMRSNVLAYPAHPDFPRPDRRGKYIGEIIVNPDYIRRRGESLPRMVIHGFLHLAGYDHVRRSDRIKMEREEQRILAHVLENPKT